MKPWRSTFLTNSIIFGANLVGGLLAARTLGVEDRGLLAAIIYWPNFISEIAAVGLNEGIVIRTAKTGTTDTLRATIFVISFSLALFFGLISYHMMPSLLGEARQDYLKFSQFYLLIFLFFTLLATNLIAIDQGELKFYSFNIQRITQAITYPLLILGLWLTNTLTVKSAAIAVLSGTGIIALLRIWNARFGLTKRPSLTEAHELLMISLRLYVANIIIAFSMQTDKMALVLFSNDIQLGLYVVAFTAAGAIQSLFVTTYINIMMPTAVKIRPQMKNIKEILTPLYKLIAIIILCSILLILFIPYLISFVYGDTFNAAGPYAQILSLAFLFIGIKKVLVYLLRSWRLNRPAIFSELFTVFILIFGSYLAIHWWNTIGLCILVLLAHALGTLFLSYYFFKEITINPPATTM